MSEKLSVEEIIKRLEANVALLQDEKESLDSNIKTYEESVKLYNEAEKMLKEAKQKIEIYRPETNTVEDFEDE